MKKKDDLPITARLPVEDVAKLEKIAAEADRTRSAELRRAVRAHIERIEHGRATK